LQDQILFTKVQELLDTLDELRLLNINMNAIKCSKMDVALKTAQRECRLPQVCDAIKDVISRWRVVCQSEKEKINRRHAGGNLGGKGDEEDDEDASHITCFVSEPKCPEKVSRQQWNAIRKKFNFSQQGVISYVCDGILQDSDDTMVMDVVGAEGDKGGAGNINMVLRSQDTHISLVQGPPGTGKTHCIAGMAGALMFFGWNESSAGTAAAAGMGEGGGPRTSKELRKEIDPNDPKIKRLPMCAPSNAAVDELVSRIKKSVPAGNGYPFTGLRLVRLGKVVGAVGVVGTATSGTSEVEQSTLEWQIEEKAKVTPNWIQLEQCRLRVIELEARHATGSGSMASIVY
jgi:hypothetical protein